MACAVGGYAQPDNRLPCFGAKVSRRLRAANVYHRPSGVRHCQRMPRSFGHSRPATLGMRPDARLQFAHFGRRDMPVRHPDAFFFGGHGHPRHQGPRKFREKRRRH